MLLSFVIFIVIILANERNVIGFVSFNFHNMMKSSLNKKEISKAISLTLRMQINEFQQFGLPNWLIENCNRLNFTTPTDVQLKTIPVSSFTL